MAVSERAQREMERGRIVSEKHQRYATLQNLLAAKKVFTWDEWSTRHNSVSFYLCIDKNREICLGTEYTGDPDYPSEKLIATIMLALHANNIPTDDIQPIRKNQSWQN